MMNIFYILGTMTTTVDHKFKTLMSGVFFKKKNS